jgi:4-diphosphocytidyl-2-C-methyl-D-erythritol kinase
MIAFPNCKINLGLSIIRKRADGFHDLESIFYPVALQDALEIIQDPSPAAELSFTSSGAPVAGPIADNSCMKAYRILKKDFPQLPSVRMHLHKQIPSGAGLGGGSADGAFTLALLNKKFNLGIGEDRLMELALSIGSDCPFFIKNKPCHVTGRGERLEEIALDLSGYKITLVHPGIHIPTARAFSKITPSGKTASLKNIIQMPVEKWKDVLKNDFEDIVFAEHPEVKSIREQLYRQGAVYASMSGSGSTVYGLFDKGSNPMLRFPAHYLVREI